MSLPRCLLLFLALATQASAAPRQHTVVLGKWHMVAASNESGDSLEVPIRQLIIDGRIKEYTAGAPHEVTDRFFVIRRAHRLNDSLPEEARQPARWVWRLDGWISVDRQTGHITQLNLPAFDPEASQVNWYRDYAAYCGSSDDGSKAYLIIFQLGKRKPILKKEFPGPSCPGPKWDRGPSRVTFTVGSNRSSFTVHARGAELQTESNDEEGPE